VRRDGRPWHGGRVLVCEDNVLIAAVLCEFLRECGLEPIGPFGDLESAVHMARVRALDGAILDINLKGRPCFPICAILSARRIPFVFLTGYPDAAIPIECRGAPLVAKPFDATEMKEVVAHMLVVRTVGRCASISRPASGTDGSAVGNAVVAISLQHIKHHDWTRQLSSQYRRPSMIVHFLCGCASSCCFASEALEAPALEVR
jgi:DNA-binding response OmpR family regulator